MPRVAGTTGRREGGGARGGRPIWCTDEPRKSGADAQGAAAVTRCEGPSPLRRWRRGGLQRSQARLTREDSARRDDARGSGRHTAGVWKAALASVHKDWRRCGCGVTFDTVPPDELVLAREERHRMRAAAVARRLRWKHRHCQQVRPNARQKLLEGVEGLTLRPPCMAWTSGGTRGLRHIAPPPASDVHWCPSGGTGAAAPS